MLVGRDEERRHIAGLLDGARAGSSGALLLRGDPGVGKSALCRFAVEQANGFEVLTARGVQAEAELAFSGLAELLQPLLDRLDLLPPPQASALAGALAIGPVAPGDPFTVSAATLTLLASATDDRPLLAVVDDAHWLDTPSLEALLFAARRMQADGVALLLTARPAEGAVVGSPGLAELDVGGLDPAAAQELLRRHTSRTLHPAVAQRLSTATAGNPLALLELPKLLNDAQLAGHEPLGEPLPAGPAVQRAFRRRIDELPGDAQEALLVAAASDTGAMDAVATAVRELGVDPAEAFAACEAAGLVMIEGARLEFHHPLVRAAAYHGTLPGPRRRAHQALAGALDGHRRAWHLAAATLGPDEDVAAALEQAGVDARERTGHAVAAGAFERAAQLSPDNRNRARRLVAGAHEAQLAGQYDRAAAMLEVALAHIDEPLLRADAQLVRGQVELWRSAPLATHGLLMAEAAAAEPLDAARAAMLFTTAFMPTLASGDVDLIVATAQRAHAAGERAGGPVRTLTAAVLGGALILDGRAGDARPLLADSEAAFLAEPALSAMDPLVGQYLANALMWLGEYGRSRLVLDRVVSAARAASAPAVLPLLLGALAELQFRTGMWTAASASAHEAVQLADDTGQGSVRPFGLVILARVEAGQGRAEECRAHVREALHTARPRGLAAADVYAGSALGLLDLGLGRTDEAIAHLEALAGLTADLGLRAPAVVQWAPDLVEAYVRAGRREDARAALAAFEAQVAGTENAWALAAAARCRGLLATDDGEAGRCFAEALAWGERAREPFERARTELCLGEVLRRRGRRAEARKRLRSALAVFQRLGAQPWARRAATEVGASVETARRDQTADPGLTPQEMQVALVVARGATNAEAAAALFLSPKTVEFHLHKIYRKLSVRSRTEMARHPSVGAS